MGICGICGNTMNDCKENLFCPRTIINEKNNIAIKNEWGEETKYFSFADCTSAMEEYAQQVLLKERTFIKETLTEKIKTK